MKNLVACYRVFRCPVKEISISIIFRRVRISVNILNIKSIFRYIIGLGNLEKRSRKFEVMIKIVEMDEVIAVLERKNFVEYGFLPIEIEKLVNIINLSNL